MAEMDRRISMESQMIPLEEYSEKQPGFAGHWIGQPTGGIIKVAFAGDADQHRPAIAALAPPGSKVDVFDVHYTLAELDADLEQVEQARIGLTNEGTWIRTLGIDSTTNRVEVGVEDLTAAAVSELRSRFGDAFIVERSGSPIPSGYTDRLAGTATKSMSLGACHPGGV